MTSLREGIWTSDLAIFYLWIANSPDRAAFFIAALACGLVAFVALQMRQRLAGTALSIISAARLADVLVVLICIAAPTIALESSSQIWPAGTRWPMLYQVTTPALLLIIFAFVLTITTAPSPLRYRLWITGVSIGVAIGAVFSLGHNRVQIDISRNESFVRDSMMRMIAEDLAMGATPPLQVLLMLRRPQQIEVAIDDGYTQSDDGSDLAAS